VVEQIPVRIGAGERRDLAHLARRLLAEEPALAATEAFGPGVARGLSEGPALLFEDHSEIGLFAGRGIPPLEYRSLLLAGDGDLVLLGGRRSPAFEAYCRDVLKLGQVEMLHPGPSRLTPRPPLARRCSDQTECFSHLVDTARRHGRLALVPYIGMGSAWVLAGAVAARSGAKVWVAAPLPRLTRRVNDKLWFARRVSEVLGQRSLPPTYSAFGPAALAGRVGALARRFERVVVKVPDSAGSAGNIVFDSADLRAMSLAALRRRLLGLLADLGWHDTYPLMVSVWEWQVLSSPSVQLWIPAREEGPPVVEGIFHQIVRGEAAEFIGAIPSDLPRNWHLRLAEEAVRLACLLQELGYFGRCSLDAAITGWDFEAAELHWIECNGRWGGVSIPMTLANRLTGDWRRRPFVVVQRASLQVKLRSFSDILRVLDKRLFRPGDREEGVVLLAPGQGLERTGLYYMVLAETTEAAMAEAKAVSELLLGGGDPIWRL
jgi:hypothetical protein